MQKGRRKKVRYIQKMPQIVQFSPRGKPGRPDEVELTIDQFEAVKLADYQGYDQFEGAKVMGVSRPTFGRSLRQGRKILADALVNGKTLRIRMGNVQVGVRKKNLPHRSEMNKANQNEEMVRQAILGYAEHKDGRQQESRVEP
ncbi:MAG: hypothetical protein A2Y04_05050 [Omnitrophica WOR_2 bacterium GWC2_45_7]|nr:MAG: hypothetical protein A2Y04_05050 [Omnitrophica WOR_2 bacterium GWC2_45_7]